MTVHPFRNYKACGYCGGHGENDDGEECWRCGGSGEVRWRTGNNGGIS